MSYSENYNSLVKDTISYLEDLKDTHITLSLENLSFYKEELTKKTSPKKERKAFHTKTAPKINIDIAKIKTPPLKQPAVTTITEEKTEPVKKKEFIQLEAPKAIFNPLSDIKETYLKIANKETYIEKPLNDREAKEIKDKWQYKTRAAPITILAYKENQKDYKFLEQLSIALDVYFLPTKLISAYFLEKNNHWESFLSANQLKLIITCDSTISDLKNLKKYYKEVPSQSKFYLNNTDLFILPDISIYFIEPLLKSSLFTSIRQKLSIILENENE